MAHERRTPRRGRPVPVGLLAVALALAACGGPRSEPVATDEPASSEATTTTETTTTPPSTGVATTIPDTTPAPSAEPAATAPDPPRTVPRPSPTAPGPAPSPPPAPAPPPVPVPTGDGAPAFGSRIDGVTRDMVASSWREGCPVHHLDLRQVTATHWGFDGRAHTGRIVVHADVAADVVIVLGRLYEARFPLERMVPVDEFGADDDASMAADNTSAFNCRPVTGRTGVWSQHSYGRAVDVNPVQNPYVTSSTVLPPAGVAYLDRSTHLPGMIRAGDVVVSAFASIGWSWGGYWSSIKDYQHFSRSGR